MVVFYQRKCLLNIFEQKLHSNSAFTIHPSPSLSYSSPPTRSLLHQGRSLPSRPHSCSLHLSPQQWRCPDSLSLLLLAFPSLPSTQQNFLQRQPQLSPFLSSLSPFLPPFLPSLPPLLHFFLFFCGAEDDFFTPPQGLPTDLKMKASSGSSKPFGTWQPPPSSQEHLPLFPELWLH